MLLDRFLLAGATVAAGLLEIYDAAVVGAVVVEKTMMGFFEEHRAGGAIEALGRTGS